jgi:hypothetical protein
VQLLISVVNHTKGLLKDEAVQVVIRAVNRQIAHDFEPYWNISAELRLEARQASGRLRCRCPSYAAMR